MGFFSKTGAFVNEQAADWRVFHEAEKQYLNSPAGFAKICGKGVVHWAFSSLFAIYYGVSFLYDGRMTEIPGSDLVSSSGIFMAGFLVLRLVIDLLYKRLTLKRFLGYVLGAAIGAAILIGNLPELLQFSTQATLQYLTSLFLPWGLCEIVAFSFGPMTNAQRPSKPRRL